ncbi:MAG: ATP-binding protein [Bacteroidales bacterium]
MAFRNFRLQVILRVLLIALTIFLLLFVYHKTTHILSFILLVVVALAQVYFLIRYVEQTNRRLANFLQSIRYADFSSSFTGHRLGKSFEGLNRAFSEVINDFKKYRAEKEEHYNYLQTVVQHINIGILVYTRAGKVDVFNNAVKKMLRIKRLRHVQDLHVIKKDIPEMLLNLRSGDKLLVKLFMEDELLQLAIAATEFRMRGEEYVLVSLQNISSELDEKEIESWQKLIRVLTHEITNSITPISSLASTVREMLLTDLEGGREARELDTEDMENIDGAISTIQNRSQGLLNFVEVYRNLTRIPKPNFRYFPVSDLFERSRQLLKPKMDELGIRYNIRVFPPELMITADPDLLDQVVINLLLNAMDAVKNQPDPEISILATLNDHNRVVIDFEDNGYGIKPDIMDKIFMPFFTSKKHGSGIGLSLSRQIMHLHKGSVKVKSKPEEGTTFRLIF